MPIERSQFERIKAAHGGYASWAVWANAGGTPKSNIGDLRVLDPDVNSTLLDTLRPNVVMVGLNISRPVAEAFRNFHDPSPRACDFKLRHALAGTHLWGAYMTDVIKGVEAVKSSDLLEHLRRRPSLAEENIRLFRAELVDLDVARPTIVAFGRSAHDILRERLLPSEYARLIRVRHYSDYVGKEAYREHVLTSVERA